MFLVITPAGTVPSYYGPFNKLEAAEQCAVECCKKPTDQCIIVRPVVTIEADANLAKATRQYSRG